MPSATAKHASAVAVRRRLSSGMQSLQPRGLGFEIRFWSGARDLNPGPHGPEFVSHPSNGAGFDAFQFGTRNRASVAVQIWGVFLANYYTNYYMTTWPGDDFWHRLACAGASLRAKHRKSRPG